MKLQLARGRQRWRCDEAELARLLAGERLEIEAGFARQRLRFGLCLFDQATAVYESGSDGFTLHLPRDAVLAYQQRLPCRDGFDFELDGQQLSFEVDVRDSVRQRGPRRRDGADANT